MCKPLASIINTLLQCSGGDIRITIGLEITGAADVHQREREREREFVAVVVVDSMHQVVVDCVFARIEYKVVLIL
jgi:hypothetical protein